MTRTPDDGAEALARLGHLEPVLEGRSVLVLCGAPEAGAVRAWLAARGMSNAVVAEDESALAPPFDRIVLHPGAFLSAERIDRLRALLAPAGLLAVGLRPGDAAGEALLRAAFPVVEAASVLPVPAWAVVPERAAAGALTWDGRALAAPPSVSRLLLCGSQPSGLVRTTLVAGSPGSTRPGLDEAAERAGLENRIAALEAEVLALSWRRDDGTSVPTVDVDDLLLP